MKTFAFLAVTICLLSAGCGNYQGFNGFDWSKGWNGWDGMGMGMGKDTATATATVPGAGYVKPTVAVARFNNNASVPGNWNVGDGLKDVLADRLVATDRFRVVERPDLAAVTDEVKLQQSGLTRQQQRATPGRVKNAQYLIKGTVVDFGHVSTTANWFDWRDRMSANGKSNKAVVSLMLQVVDVESGEIICSEFMEESVRAEAVEVQAAYKDVAFGGRAFWRKPLGEAMAKVVDKAARRVAGSIAAQPWGPRVAGVQDAQVLINGGKDRGLRPGMRFDVYQQGSPILDPDTGDLIGTHPGRPVGRVEVREVYGRYSAATMLQGQADQIEYGQRCAKAGVSVPLAALPRRGPITPTPTAEPKR